MNVGLTVAGRDPAKPQLSKQLRSDMSLWQVLRQFEDLEKGLDLTGRGTPSETNGGGSGQLLYEEPVVNIMGKEYASVVDLQKTLSQCGINGGNMRLRVDFRKSDRTLFDALKQISEYIKEVAPDQIQEQVKAPPAPAVEQEKPEAAAVNDSPQAPDTSATDAGPMDVDAPSSSAATTETATVDPLLPTGIFSAPTTSTPIAAQTKEDDSVYEPTIAHAQLRQQQLLTRSQNTRLKSDKELQAEAAAHAAKVAKVTEIVAKVRFPDQTVAQWRIGPEQDGAFLYRAVRAVMAHADSPFKLVLPGSGGTIRDDDKTLIKGYGLTASTLLNLVWEPNASEAARKEAFLKGSVASQAKDLVVPRVPEAEPEEEEEATAQAKRPAKPEGSGDGVAKKLPKWLKLPGGKK